MDDLSPIKYDPPMQERTTEQLVHILEEPEKWKEDIVKSAEAELIHRNVSLSIPKQRKKSKLKAQTKVRIIKSSASFTSREKLLIVLIGPLATLLLFDFVPFHAGSGFKKKNRQAVLFQLVGFCLWGIVFYLCSELGVF